MRKLLPLFSCTASILSSFFLVSCATTDYTVVAPEPQQQAVIQDAARFHADFAARLPSRFETRGKRTIVVDPNVHAWGAYDGDGNLVRAGIATAGAPICPPDTDESNCHTGVGRFRITSLGDGDCYSKQYPRPYGGGLMPYCMFFNGGEALHGSPDPIVVDGNLSHGCVRMRIPDAEWMRYNFAQIGMPVVILPYQS